MITKDNIVTLAYKGFAAIFYGILRKKNKIRELFIEENVFDDSILSNQEKMKRKVDSTLDIEKIPFTPISGAKIRKIFVNPYINNINNE